MKYDYYKELSIYEDFEIYDFISTGSKGDIAKRIRFDFVDLPDTYNLAFGDLKEGGRIDDYSISDNNDMAKILATIVFVAKVFLQQYPDRTISFRGSTAERTRLYRMAISNNLNELLEFFDIYGVYKDSNSSFFTKNEDYFAFLVKKKL
jgi:hypothetical protein